MIDIVLLTSIDYNALLIQGSTIGLILGGSISIFGIGVMYALRLFNIIL